MSLLDDFKTPCVFMEKKDAEDGEGGAEAVWSQGAEFVATIVFDTSVEARRAEKESVNSRYTVTADRGTVLAYHDVFKRLSDGKVFRVNSDGDDKVTPERAAFQFVQVTAEEWMLT